MNVPRCVKTILITLLLLATPILAKSNKSLFYYENAGFFVQETRPGVAEITGLDLNMEITCKANDGITRARFNEELTWIIDRLAAK